MGKALPEGGRLISLEYAETHAEVARANVARAGLTRKGRGPHRRRPRSVAVLATEMAGEGAQFDLTFIDADKPNNPGYLDWAVKLTRPGGSSFSTMSCATAG